MSDNANENKPHTAKNSDSWYKQLIVPIIIALVAGGSAPWWVDSMKSYFAHPAVPPVAPSATSSPSPPVAPAEAVKKVEIGNFYHRENGCHSSSQTARFTIENADKLDRQQPGTIQGVTVEVYAANGGAISDTHFESPNVFVVTGTATGGGHWVDGLFGKGGTCVNASGGDIGAHVFGFFR